MSSNKIRCPDCKALILRIDCFRDRLRLEAHALMARARKAETEQIQVRLEAKAEAYRKIADLMHIAKM